MRVKLFRLWIVLSVAWVIAAGTVLEPSVQWAADGAASAPAFDKDRIAAAQKLAGYVDTSNPFAKMVQPDQQPAAIWAKGEIDAANADKTNVQVELRRALTDALEVLLIPPLAALALGWGILWAFTGPKRSTKSVSLG